MRRIVQATDYLFEIEISSSLSTRDVNACSRNLEHQRVAVESSICSRPECGCNADLTTSLAICLGGIQQGELQIPPVNFDDELVVKFVVM